MGPRESAGTCRKRGCIDATLPEGAPSSASLLIAAMSALNTSSVDALRHAATQCIPLPFPGQLPRAEALAAIGAGDRAGLRACEALELEAALSAQMVNQNSTSTLRDAMARLSKAMVRFTSSSRFVAI